MATGDGSAASCQPDVVSPLKVAVPRSVPVLVHRWPTCVPVFDVPLWNRMALMKPLTLARSRRTDGHRNALRWGPDVAAVVDATACDCRAALRTGGPAVAPALAAVGGM